MTNNHDHLEQRRGDARPRARRLPDPARGDHRPPSRPPCAPATATSTPLPRTATSVRSARPSAAPASPATRSSSRRRSGSATTATTRPCTRSRRAPASSASTRSTCCILHQALPSAFDLTLDAYRALEKLLADGKVRAIGVSNFMPEHLDRLLDRNRRRAGRQPDRSPPVLPAARRCRTLHAEHGILTQAWSPIGGITFYRDGEHSSTFDDPTHRSRSPTAARQVARPR